MTTNLNKAIGPSRLKIIAALLALYAVVAAWGLPLSAPPPPQRARVSEPQHDDVANEPRVAQPVPILRPQRQPPAPVEMATSTAPAAVATPAPRAPASVPQLHDDPEAFQDRPFDPFVDQKIAAIRDQWERESDDLAWSKQAREEAITLFAEHQVPEELLHDVRCRRTVCRIAVDATDRMRMVGLAQHLKDNMPGAYFSVIDDEAFAYVPR